MPERSDLEGADLTPYHRRIEKQKYKELIMRLNALEAEYKIDSSMYLRSLIDEVKISINPNYFIAYHKDYLKL